MDCTNLKDEINCSYNGGGVVYVLKSELSRSAIQYTESLILCVTQFFMEFLKLAEGGGGFDKKMHFALNFCIKQKCTLRYVFIYKKPDTLRHIFIYKKQCTLHYVLYAKFILSNIMIPKYKRTYNNSDQSDYIDK